MPISTAKIDKQIRKLQQLKRFASDPEMAPLLESLFTSSYTEKQHAAATNGSRKGDLVKAVGMAVQHLGRRFKVSDVLSYDATRRLPVRCTEARHCGKWCAPQVGGEGCNLCRCQGFRAGPGICMSV